MKKITILDFIIVLTSFGLGFFLYYFNSPIPNNMLRVFINVPFTLVAFLLSISALVVNSFQHDIVLKLIKSGHYDDLLSSLKTTSYVLVSTGSVSLLYGVFHVTIKQNNLLLISSSIILFLFCISIGYLIKNIMRIFIILKYLGVENEKKSIS